jgi:hypothetical protein
MAILYNTLLEVLYKIADLKHTLYLGAVSRKQCGVLLSTYSKQVKEVILQLNTWNQSQVEKLCIDINANLRKRVGFDSFIHKLPSLFKEDYNYRSVSKTTTDIITAHATAYGIPDETETIDLFQKDVKVIAKEGKLYYLPGGQSVK